MITSKPTGATRRSNYPIRLYRPKTTAKRRDIKTPRFSRDKMNLEATLGPMQTHVFEDGRFHAAVPKKMYKVSVSVFRPMGGRFFYLENRVPQRIEDNAEGANMYFVSPARTFLRGGVWRNGNMSHYRGVFYRIVTERLRRRWRKRKVVKGGFYGAR